MENKRWILPEGIDEILPPWARKLEGVRRALLDLYFSWGYELVIPPVIEYLESLLTGTGSDLDLKTFKLTDQMTGRLMGVRADITPQAARVDAHQLRRATPTRLCYIDTVLHTRPDGFAGSRSPLQIGAELYGHKGVESDVEVLRLMMKSLDLTGVRDVYLDLGHVGIFRGLARSAGLDPEQETALFDALQRKAQTEIGSLLDSYGIAGAPERMLRALAELSGDDALLRAREVFADADPSLQEALAYLEQVATMVQRWLPDTPVHFDLAELRGYHFHTGVVFAAFVPGLGQEVARGGRYDDIGRAFGRARPATGFSADLKTLIQVGLADALYGAPDDGVFVPWEDDVALQRRVEELRAQGRRVVCALPGQRGGAREMGCREVLVRQDGRWTLVSS